MWKSSDLVSGAVAPPKHPKKPFHPQKKKIEPKLGAMVYLRVVLVSAIDLGEQLKKKISGEMYS